MPDWDRLKWYAVLAVGSAFTAASIYILVVKREPFAWAALAFGLAMVAMAIHDLWPWLIEGRPVSPDDVLQRFPEQVTLRTPCAKLIFFLIGTLLFGFSLAGIAFYSDLNVLEKAMLWVGAAGCVAAVPAFMLAILRGSTLRLDAVGMHMYQGLKSSTHLWTDVGTFTVVDVGMPMVMFDDATMNDDSSLVQFNRSMVGRAGGLPDSYGMPPGHLAWLLNEWRARAMANLPPPSRSAPAP